MELPVPLIAAVLAGGITALAMPFARSFGFYAGLVDVPKDHSLHIHPEPIPITGGLLLLLASAGVAAGFGANPPARLLAAAAILLAFGFVDDLRPLPPWIRLLSQLLAGLVLTTSIELGSITVRVCLVALCVNSFNLMDGQDGLAGGLFATAAFALAWISDASGWVNASIIAAAVGGSLVGFTAWNLSPMRIFLGNGGCAAIALVIAALSARLVLKNGMVGLLAVAVTLAPAFVEVGFTIWRRGREGRSILAGDRRHTYDLLSRRLERRRVTSIYWLVGFVSAVLGISLVRFSAMLQLAITLTVYVIAITVTTIIWRSWAGDDHIAADPAPSS